jgi:hypothetical protein
MDQIAMLSVDIIVRNVQNWIMTFTLYNLVFTCLLTFLGGSSSWAAIKVGVEPYLGYGQFSYQADSVTEAKYGTVLGGKGGFFISGNAWLALDYHLGGPYNLEKNDNEYLNRMWGAGLGLTKKTTRFWVGYYYDAVIDDIERNIIYTGTAIKVSLGFQYESKLSINIEYSVQDYTEAHANSTSVPLGLKVSTVFLSLSSPLILN